MQSANHPARDSASSIRYSYSAPGYSALVGVAIGIAVLLNVLRSLNAGGAKPGATTLVLVIGPGVLVLLAATVVFYRLRTEVGGGVVSWKFGPGLFGGTIRVADITRVAAVRNPWYYGWGIRTTPEGKLYTVSGLSAVEIVVGQDVAVRIGTDDVVGLMRAIEEERG